MANVTEQVKCALCGAEMPVDTQYCPKCGSLNAHFGVRESLGMVEPVSRPTATTDASAPVSPGASTPAVQQTTPQRHVSRIPLSTGHLYQVVEQDQAAEPEEQAWTGPTVYDPTSYDPTAYDPPEYDPRVEVPPTWHEEMVPVPRRRFAPTGKRAGIRDPTTAFFLEMFGLVGFLGLGHIYANRFARGLALMWTWWIVFAVVIVTGLISASWLFAVLVLCGGPALSGYWISTELKRKAQAGSGQDSNRRYLK